MKKKIFSVTLIFMGIQEILQYFLILRLVTFIRTDDSSLYLNGECEGVMSHFWAKFESEEKRIFIRMRKFSRGSRSPKINEQENGIFLASYWSICFDFLKIFQKNSERKSKKSLPMFSRTNCRFRLTREKCARVVVYRRLGILRSYTLGKCSICKNIGGWRLELNRVRQFSYRDTQLHQIAASNWNWKAASIGSRL